MKRIFTLGLACCLLCTAAFATAADDSTYVFRQKVYPAGMDNYLFIMYFYNGETAYSLQGKEMSAPGGPILSIRINPAGFSYTLLTQKKKKKEVAVFDIYKADRQLHFFKNLDNPTAICYTPDARSILIADGSSLKFFETKKYTFTEAIELPFVPTDLQTSRNGYYLAATDGFRVAVWNLEEKVIRKEFEVDSPVKRIAFSDDSANFGILTGDGLLSTYDTRNFLINQTYDGLGEARSFYFHPDGKYISVVTGDARIAVINVLDENDRTFFDDENGGITDARFVREARKRVFLAYNTTRSITYNPLGALAPNYTRLLEEELQAKMNDWMKMMPDETLEEYNQRVNEESRKQQMRLFEEEIATRLADNLLGMSEITLGNYNADLGLLSLNFSNMPTIFLPVPAEEVTSFSNMDDISFENVKYGLTRDDKFEVVYAEVHNKVTGKNYVFDNRDRRSLDYLYADESFVPIELIQQASMEELKLQEIKDKVVDAAKQTNTISDHTHIAVNAQVLSDTDASGKGILNYEVGFTYDVEADFSARDDFAPGRYKVEESGAAMSMLAIVKEAFEGDFSQYIQEGKKLNVRITGMADGMPIRNGIKYDGAYGDFVNEPVYKDGDLSSVTVTKAEGITKNEQLAFLRAIGVRDYIEKNLPSLRQMRTDYQENIELSDEKGGAFRRITVLFTFVDAF